MTRVLIVADIHANEPALEAVLAAEPDRDSILFLGDAVDCGPHPDAVCDRLLDLDDLAGVHGNHDQAVLALADENYPDDDPYARWKQWSYDRLSAESRTFLESLGRTAAVSAGDRILRLHHGDFPPPARHDGGWVTRVTPDDEPSFFESIAARYDEDVVLHGHSHYPFAATVAGTTFINPGSVGLQRPGWPVDRARYAVLEDGTFDLRSVRYDPSPVIEDSRALENPFLSDWDRADVDAEPRAAVTASGVDAEEG